MKNVEKFYDSVTEREWQRLERMRLQYDIAMRMFSDYLPETLAEIADIGGGVGRYAIELTKQGYKVTLVDLSAEALGFAENKALEAGVTLFRTLKSDARDLSVIQDASFDTVLLMGPIYHLPSHSERLQAVRESWRILKPNGIIFVDFLTRYSILQWALYRDPEYILREGDDIRKIVADGVHISPKDSSGFTDAWCAHPDQIEPLMEEGGFTKLDLAAMDCLTHENYEKLYSAKPEVYTEWFEILYRVSRDPSILGSGGHLLYVGSKVGN